MRKLMKWFNTDPQKRNRRFLYEMSKKGLMGELINAVEYERKGLPQKGKVKVKRVI